MKNAPSPVVMVSRYSPSPGCGQPRQRREARPPADRGPCRASRRFPAGRTPRTGQEQRDQPCEDTPAHVSLPSRSNTATANCVRSAGVCGRDDPRSSGGNGGGGGRYRRGVGTSTAYTWDAPCMFERNTIVAPSGVNVRLARARSRATANPRAAWPAARTARGEEVDHWPLPGAATLCGPPPSPANRVPSGDTLKCTDQCARATA